MTINASQTVFKCELLQLITKARLFSVGPFYCLLCWLEGFCANPEDFGNCHFGLFQILFHAFQGYIFFNSASALRDLDCLTFSRGSGGLF